MRNYLLTFLATIILALPQAQAHATTYYIDFSTTTSGGNGLTTASAFGSLDAFTEVARSAGDIAFVRRGFASTTNVSTLDFTSDGTLSNPIILSSDYDNIWGDFATSSETWNVQPGISFIRSSASSTTAFPGKWIYFAGDCYENPNTTTLNTCQYAYEIAQASSTGILLTVPYKGGQTSATAEMRVMPRNPQWNNANGNFQVNSVTDDYWYLKGLDLRGTASAQIFIDSSAAMQIEDDILIGDGVGPPSGIDVRCTTATGIQPAVIIKKVRTSTDGKGIASGASTARCNANLVVSDSIFDQGGGGSTAIGIGNSVGNGSTFNLFITDSFVQNSGSSGADIAHEGGTPAILRNTILRSSPPIAANALDAQSALNFEDYQGRIGFNKINGIGSGGVNSLNTIIESTSTASYLRSGGGPVSTFVRPSSRTTSIWDFNRIKLFEYPIYTDTSSKQYSVYFMATSSTAFTANPSKTELYLECEEWAHPTGATSTHRLVRSTGTVDFVGSTAWQSISVTCQPTQSGTLYLRGWYSKPLESTASNLFLLDDTPIIN